MVAKKEFYEGRNVMKVYVIYKENMKSKRKKLITIKCNICDKKFSDETFVLVFKEWEKHYDNRHRPSHSIEDSRYTWGI
jgi:hypothetical protein